MADVVGGYDDLDSYVRGDGYQGALIGRWGNRIAEGKFTLEGKEYSLFINNGPNHLHGGEFGFNAKVWDVTEKDGDEPQLVLHTVSPDGEEGYPGTMDITVTYTLNANNGLSIRYEATTDKTTILNLTNHTYFNMGGYASGSVHPLVLWVDADSYLPTDADLIPTGELRSVEGTPFDFRTPKTIGRDINMDDLGKTGKILRSSGYAVIKPCAESNQKVALIGGIVCINSTMHTEPAQTQIIIFWKNTNTHQSCGNGDIIRFRKFEKFLCRVS
jgi:galactose mutarotase-like enzyme